MATRNRTILYRKCRDALKSVRVPSSSSPSSSSGGPVIELSTASLLNPNRSYAPLSTEDPGGYSSSLATDLQSLSMDLRNKQSTYLKRLRQQKEGPDGVDLEMNFKGYNFIREDEKLNDMVVESVNDLA